MTLIRLLHVEDEPDIRDVVEFALTPNPDFQLKSCESGAEALTVAADWQPDIILLDVMMPVLDGPATLERLRANPKTAAIPIVFMTARAQTREVDRLRSLGAVGVIPKPFDPMTLAASVRKHIQPPARVSLDDLRAAFRRRVQRDAAMLEQDRMALKAESRPHDTLERIKRMAHGLAGAGGIYSFAAISTAAAALEDAATAELENTGSTDETDQALDILIGQARSTASAEVGSP